MTLYEQAKSNIVKEREEHFYRQETAEYESRLKDLTAKMNTLAKEIEKEKKRLIRVRMQKKKLLPLAKFTVLALLGPYSLLISIKWLTSTKFGWLYSILVTYIAALAAVSYFGILNLIPALLLLPATAVFLSIIKFMLFWVLDITEEGLKLFPDKVRYLVQKVDNLDNEYPLALLKQDYLAKKTEADFLSSNPPKKASGI